MLSAHGLYRCMAHLAEKTTVTKGWRARWITNPVAVTKCRLFKNCPWSVFVGFWHWLCVLFSKSGTIGSVISRIYCICLSIPVSFSMKFVKTVRVLGNSSHPHPHPTKVPGVCLNGVPASCLQNVNLCAHWLLMWGESRPWVDDYHYQEGGQVKGDNL